MSGDAAIRYVAITVTSMSKLTISPKRDTGKWKWLSTAQHFCSVDSSTAASLGWSTAGRRCHVVALLISACGRSRQRVAVIRQRGDASASRRAAVRRDEVLRQTAIQPHRHCRIRYPSPYALWRGERARYPVRLIASVTRAERRGGATRGHTQAAEGTVLGDTLFLPPLQATSLERPVPNNCSCTTLPIQSIIPHSQFGPSFPSLHPLPLTRPCQLPSATLSCWAPPAAAAKASKWPSTPSTN